MNEIVIAIISGLCVAVPSILATVMGNRASSKQATENAKLTIYRIEQLEQKVSKHNSLVERMFKVEGQIQEVQHDINELKRA